jgi:hypothetical protein
MQNTRKVNPDERRTEEKNMTTRHHSTLHESRTAHLNLPVRHPNRWRLVADLLFSPPTHLHQYRDLSRRMFEEAVDAEDCPTSRR